MKRIFIAFILILVLVGCGNENEETQPAVDNGTKAYKQKEYGKAFQLAKKSCENNDSEGCYILGKIYQSENMIEKDKSKANKSFSKACTLNHAESCRNLANYTHDDKDRLKYNLKACDLNDSISCIYAGNMYSFPYNYNSIKKNDTQSIKYYTRSCETLNNIDGCKKLSASLLTGRGIRQDTLKAEKLYVQYIDKYTNDCKNGAVEACHNIAEEFLSISRIFYKRNIAKSVEIYKIACSFKDAKACSILGDMHFLRATKYCIKAKGNNRFRYFDINDKTEYIDNNPIGCVTTTGMRTKIQGLENKEGLGKEYYGKACDLGVSNACKAYAILNLVNFTKINRLEWTKPSGKVCRDNNGTMDTDKTCRAKLEDAKNICQDMSENLPTIEQLKNVSFVCDNNLSYNNMSYKVGNAAYRFCYRSQGFKTNIDNWSSSYRTNTSGLPRPITYRFKDYHGETTTFNSSPGESTSTGKHSVNCLK